MARLERHKIVIKTYPKISIVTPTYNCGALIRGCIESVLKQNYENVEHIIIDGASTDDTVDILKEYPHLKWVSEPDDGEVAALNKAMQMTTGDIIGWLNADDSYSDGTFQRVADEMLSGKDRHFIYGKTIFINEEKQATHWVTPAVPINKTVLPRWFTLNLFQPSIFFSREVFLHVGLFNEALCYGVDYEYWFRVAHKGYQFHFVDQVFSKAMIYRSGGKTETPYAIKAKEWLGICMSYLTYLPLGERIQFYKDYYNFRMTFAKVYYGGDPVEFPDTEEQLTGLVQAYKELTNVDPKMFFTLLTNRPSQGGPLLLNANLIGQYGENLFQHGHFTEAAQAFEWALAFESQDHDVREKFAVGSIRDSFNSGAAA